jgi:hypothetical protein
MGSLAIPWLSKARVVGPAHTPSGAEWVPLLVRVMKEVEKGPTIKPPKGSTLDTKYNCISLYLRPKAQCPDTKSNE